MIKLHTPESLAMFNRCEQLQKERDEAREAYEAETQSTLEMAKRILELESEVNLWRNRHSELFMELNPVTEPILQHNKLLSDQ